MRWMAMTLAAGVLVLCGCESAGPGRLGSLFADSRPDPAEEERRRTAFLTEQDPAAIRWLLAHRIEAGMSLRDVSMVLGYRGERIYDDARIKQQSSIYQPSDEIYSWGPDRNGTSYYLIFRNDALFEYDAAQYIE